MQALAVSSVTTRENLVYKLAERPRGDIVPGKTFRHEVLPAPTEEDLKDGQILVESLYLSLDPAMRGWLNDTRSYVPPVQIGEVMRGGVIARVLASKSSKVQAGALVTANIGWQEIGIANEESHPKFEVAELPPNGRVTDLLGVLGGTGLTAYFGLEKIGKPKPGETVVVSGAAGATGSVVGQLAKLAGARVVGIAGSEDKCRWLREELGFDAALNYKDADFRQQLRDATPDYINVFWDNVGGDVLEAALSRAAKYARFVMCGAISQYNSTAPQGPRNIFTIIQQRILMQGFIIFDYAAEWPEARKVLAQYLDEGKIKREETVVKGGLRVVEEAFLELFKGTNKGKLLVEVKNPQNSPKL